MSEENNPMFEQEEEGDEEEEEEYTEETVDSEDEVNVAEMALEHKKEGNEHYVARRYSSAVKSYTAAIALQPDDQAFYSNRAAAYYNLENYQSSLNDCKKALELDPDYLKNYNRAGMSLLQMVGRSLHLPASFAVFSLAVFLLKILLKSCFSSFAV